MQAKTKITLDQRHLILFHKYRKRVSFTDIASGCGITRSTLNNILNGRVSFSELTARRLAEYFGIDWHDFYKEQNAADN